uniref:Methionyl-tRNA formyltransferase n=1 Tax=Kwoniella dejecticola CBS 10117 TaxID=1296121 RepID=A0A1A5ZY23_9TREE|nr:methionyl-tRNA formyltransferase [Kwoniella dejecticola CBS 10117]OBR82709.1 methionyl-tRNA formyltransferase [Kwoniella dejecticola CBS 10117]
MISPPLGPLAALPDHVEPLKRFRILLLVSSINSFTQRVYSYLHYLGFEQVSIQLATSDEDMLNAAEGWDADIVLCPFLTKKLPESIYSRWITLVVHPGPPGDAGPSSLDWVLMGDDGSIADSSEALDVLLNKSIVDRGPTQRSHWGTICFQANEELDGGAVWAWEQYALPPIGSITKAGLYQNQHSIGAISATIHALIRVYEQTAGAGLPKSDWLKATPKSEWSTHCVSLRQPFLGGSTTDRPLLQSTKRRPIFEVHTAEDILRILNASDSQPGSMLNSLTANSKSSLFAYGAHVHADVSTIPASLYVSLGYESFSEIPNGKIIATRQGAIFIKTRQVPGRTAAGIWITHGRVPRGKDKPIDPKIPMVDAIRAAGHGAALDGVREWEQNTWTERIGEWQEVYVKSIEDDGGIAQLVYWNFYNGAFTTTNCQYLLRALQWATAPKRGNVKILALMGGHYFSNGIALNTIENASSPGRETWDNISAIDDIVSFLPLSQRGIVTVACVRGNAAAGGVALAAACDVVLAGRNVVLNPSYRGMGLHGSELHSYSYLKRCGPVHAATLLRAMKPLNTAIAHQWGLVDIEIGSSHQTLAEAEPLFVNSVLTILNSPAEHVSSPESTFRCAPWCRPSQFTDIDPSKSLVGVLCESKISNYTSKRDFPPLLHYRNEELSQMLLDSFHPIRSNRYHSRRYKFIRKTKASSTPARYMIHNAQATPDEEDTREFDDAPGWVRGEEWGFVDLPTPKSLETSESTRIDIFNDGTLDSPAEERATQDETPVHSSTTRVEHASGIGAENGADLSHVPPEMPRKSSEVPTLIPSALIDDHAHAHAHPSPAMSSSSSGEGPLPTTPMMDIPPTKSAHSASSLSPSRNGRLQISGSSSPASPSKRLSLFRNTSSTSSSSPRGDHVPPLPISASSKGGQKQTVVSGKQMIDQFGNVQSIHTQSQSQSTKGPKEREKKGTFRIIKKKVKNALRSLNGGESSSTSTAIKTTQPKSHGSLSGGNDLTTSKSISSNSSNSRSITMTRSKSSTNTPSAISKKGISSDDYNFRIKDQKEPSRENGTCEWPCLVTGGEEEGEGEAEAEANEGPTSGKSTSLVPVRVVQQAS